MQQVQGIVTAIESREVTTKFGVKPVFSILVDGMMYEGLWKQPNFPIGSTVAFYATQGKFGFKVEGQIQIVALGTGAPQAAPQAANGYAAPQQAPGFGGNPQPQMGAVPGAQTPPPSIRPTAAPKAAPKNYHGSFPTDPEDGRHVITMQSSLKVAEGIVMGCVAHMSEAKKKALTPQALWEEIKPLMHQIADEVSGQNMMAEILSERSARYQEYQKLLSGEGLDSPAVPDDAADLVAAVNQ